MSKKKMQERVRWLRLYVSDDDVTLDKDTFLRYVADRINDDLASKKRAL